MQIDQKRRELSMLDSLLFWLAPLSLPRHNGTVPAPLPPREPAYGIFVSSDGHRFTLSIAGEDHLWRALCGVLGLDAPASLSEAERIARGDTLAETLRAELGRHPWSWLADRLAAAGVPFAPIFGLDCTTSDPRFLDRGVYTDLPGPEGRTERHARLPIFGATDDLRVPLGPVPGLGEQTREILGVP